MNNHFRVKSIINLEETKINENFEESDYSLITKDNKFIQFEYIEVEDKKREPTTVRPGIWAIQKTMSGLILLETSFNVDFILQTHPITVEISKRIDIFFNKFDSYRKKNMLPIRKFLLYGPGGTGKSTCIIEAIDKYTKDNKTAVIVWHTDKFEASDVKDFFQTFKYENGIEKLIVVVEDIGGVEIDEVRRPSLSSLLSLLDNKEQTFKIPTLVLATTNHPETLLGNLTNRPGRFSDKIEVGYPKSKERLALLKFFYPEELNDQTLKLISGSQTEKFTPDHIKNIVENADLYGTTIEQAILDMIKEIGYFNKAFGKDKEMGVRNSFYDAESDDD